MKAPDVNAVAARETVARFRTTFALEQLYHQLPLVFPSAGAKEAHPDTFRTRSWYTYPGWAGLTAGDVLTTLGDLYIALHLIDFSTLRAELVTLTGIHVNARGETPFDPVSLFLCCLLRWETRKGWKSLARFLANPEGDCWRRLCGFQPGDIPAASTLRRFFHRLGAAFLTDLCPRFITLLQQAGLLPPHDPDSHIPARDGLPLAGDGMLHAAHSTMKCSKVTATCYQPTSAEHPRPCPARAAGHEGCLCDQPACEQACRRATPRDSAARLIHYSGRNQEGVEDPRRARNVYGYRSYAQSLIDDDLHVYWVTYTTVHAANTDERTLFPPAFAQLRQRLPRLPISEVVADAALGYTECLNAVYAARAIPVIDIRHATTDDDPDACLLRGYNAHGQPLCAHGFPMFSQGLDYPRLRAGWACRQVCTQQSESAAAHADCPFRDPQRPLGMIRHITTAFTHPDGSQHARLARLFAYKSPTWNAHYGARRNATESRNGQLERLGLKRLWSYDLAGALADIVFADVLINLRTLGRLVRQASSLTG